MGQVGSDIVITVPAGGVIQVIEENNNIGSTYTPSYNTNGEFVGGGARSIKWGRFSWSVGYSDPPYHGYPVYFRSPLIFRLKEAVVNIQSVILRMMVSSWAYFDLFTALNKGQFQVLEHQDLTMLSITDNLVYYGAVNQNNLVDNIVIGNTIGDDQEVEVHLKSSIFPLIESKAAGEAVCLLFKTDEAGNEPSFWIGTNNLAFKAMKVEIMT